MNRPGSGSDRFSHSLRAVFTYTDSGARTFEVFGAISAGTLALDVENGQSRLTWTVTKYPLNSAEAITLETVGQRATAKFTALPSDDFTIGTDTEILNPSGYGISGDTQFFDVACVNGEASSGNTCSGDESFGVGFDTKIAGTYQLCTSFNNRIFISDSSGSGQSVTNEFVLAKVTAGTNSVIRRSNYEPSTQLSTSISDDGNILTRQPVHVCYEDFLSPGRHEFKVLVSASTSSAGNSIQGPTSSWSLKLLDVQKPTPIFTDLQNSLSERVSSTVNDVTGESCVIDSSSVTVDTSSGLCSSWIDSVSRPSTGVYDITITSGVFSVVPVCGCTGGEGGSSDRNCKVNTSTQTTTFLSVRTTSDTNNVNDTDPIIKCDGQK